MLGVKAVYFLFKSKLTLQHSWKRVSSCLRHPFIMIFFFMALLYATHDDACKNHLVYDESMQGLLS